MSMMPGVPKEVRDVEIEDHQIARIEAIIRSMTPGERSDPDLIDQSRRTRIAKGSGTSSSDVSQLIAQFKQMRQMMQQMGGGPKRRKKGRGKKAKKGGRVTAKGGAPARTSAFTLPTIEEMEAQLPGPLSGGGRPDPGGSVGRGPFGS